MNQKGFIPIIFIIIGVIVATSASFGVVKYKDEITANVSKVFKPKIEAPDIESRGKDKVAEEPELIEEPIVEEEPGLEEKQDDAQKLQEQLERTEQKRLEAEEKARQKRLAEEARIQAEQEQQQQLEAQRLAEEKRKQEEARRLAEEQRQKELERQRAQESLETQMTQLFNGLIRETVKSSLSSDLKAVSKLEEIYQSQKNAAAEAIQSCVRLYDSQIQWVKDDAERKRTAYYESRRGFATQPGIIDQINQDEERDIKALEEAKKSCYTKYSINNSIPSYLFQVRNEIYRLLNQLDTGSLATLVSGLNSVESELISIMRLLEISTASISPTSIQPTSFTCSNDVGGGFSCRDNLGSNTVRCSQSVGGYFDCRDSNLNHISCEQTSLGLRCSWY